MLAFPLWIIIYFSVLHYNPTTIYSNCETPDSLSYSLQGWHMLGGHQQFMLALAHSWRRGISANNNNLKKLKKKNERKRTDTHICSLLKGQNNAYALMRERYACASVYVCVCAFSAACNLWSGINSVAILEWTIEAMEADKINKWRCPSCTSGKWLRRSWRSGNNNYKIKCDFILATRTTLCAHIHTEKQ